MTMLHDKGLPLDGAVSMLQFLTLCLTAGCTITTSGDGLAAYSASGNVITQPGTGVGGMANPRAWFVMDFGGGEQWCFQNVGASTYSYYIKSSRAAGFSGGSPSATRVPSATDEELRWGAGTDASPSGLPIFYDTNGTFGIVMGVDDTVPRRFYCGTYQLFNGVPRTLFFSDVVDVAEPGDADARVRSCLYPSGWIDIDRLRNLGGSPTYGYYTTAYQPSATPTVTYQVAAAGLAYSGTTMFPRNANSLWTVDKDPFQPAYWLRANANLPSLLKGKSNLILLNGVTWSVSGNNVACMLYSRTDPGDTVLFGDIALPWDGSFLRR